MSISRQTNAAIVAIVFATATSSHLFAEEEYWNKRGVEEMNAGRYQEAIRYFKDSLKYQPGSSIPMANMANCYYSLGEYENARRHYDWALETNNYEHALVDKNVVKGGHLAARGRCKVMLRKYDEAVQDCASAVQHAPRDSTSHFAHGEALLGARKHEAALAAFSKSVSFGHSESFIAGYRGWAFYELGHFERARDDFDVAGNRSAHALTLLSLGRGDLAGKEAELLLQRGGAPNVNELQWLTVYGCLGYRQTGRHDQAKALLDRASTGIASRDWPAPILSYLRGNLSAKSLADAAGTHNGRMSEVQLVLGLAEILNGSRDKGLPKLEWVVKHGDRSYYETHLAQGEVSHRAFSRHVEVAR